MSTIAAISSPIGAGGIGIVRVSGEDALRIADAIFSFSRKNASKGVVSACGDEQNKIDVEQEKGLRQVWTPFYMNYGVFDAGEFCDKGYAVYFPKGRSYTGEDTVEFYLHGGVRIMQGALDALLRGGAVMAKNGEFTKRAFLNGRLSLADAEGVIDMINAESVAGVKAAYRLMQGNVSKCIDAILEKLGVLIATLEATLDYPDEMEDEVLPSLPDSVNEILDDVNKLISTAKSGRIAKHGINVALAGNTNAGKSSLMNALLKEDRAIVTDVAGTTRDTVEDSFECDGVKINLVDTAGIRESDDIVEAKGIERAKRAFEGADVILHVVDTTAPDDKEWDFSGGNLALTVNQEAKVGNVKIVDALVRLFGDYAYTWIKDTFFKDAPENASEEEKEKAAASRAELDKFADVFFSCEITKELEKDPQERVITINPGFKGAAWKNFDIVGGFQGLVKKALDKMFPPKTDNNGASAQYANDPIITKVSETIVRALPLLSTKGDKLTVKTNTGDAFNKNYGTVGAAVNYLGQTWWEKKAKPFTESIMTSDNGNWLGYISKALTVAGCEYNDIAAAPLVTDEELAAAKEKRADKGLVTDKELAAAKALEANAGKADDVLKAELQAEKDLSIRKALQKAKDEARSKAFINEIFKATAEVVLNISGTDGLELSVKADVNASAGVGVSVKLGAKAYDAANYTDLAPAVETDGWYVFTITKKA